MPVLCIGAGKPQQQIQLDNLHFGSRTVLLKTQWTQKFDVEFFFPYVFTIGVRGIRYSIIATID